MGPLWHANSAAESSVQALEGLWATALFANVQGRVVPYLAQNSLKFE